LILLLVTIIAAFVTLFRVSSDAYCYPQGKTELSKN
jgi:hypothetical protein